VLAYCRITNGSCFAKIAASWVGLFPANSRTLISLHGGCSESRPCRVVGACSIRLPAGCLIRFQAHNACFGTADSVATLPLLRHAPAMCQRKPCQNKVSILKFLFIHTPTPLKNIQTIHADDTHWGETNPPNERRDTKRTTVELASRHHHRPSRLLSAEKPRVFQQRSRTTSTFPLHTRYC